MSGFCLDFCLDSACSPLKPHTFTTQETPTILVRVRCRVRVRGSGSGSGSGSGLGFGNLVGGTWENNWHAYETIVTAVSFNVAVNLCHFTIF